MTKSNSYYAVSIRAACGVLFNNGFTLEQVEELLKTLPQAAEGYYYLKDLPTKP